ncbi:hypothetical protein BH10ACT1_BH10ACT1_05000 [soil metagenome]
MTVPEPPVDPALARVRRGWLESVLDTVRQMGDSRDVTEALSRIVDAVSEVLGFGSAAINVVIADEVVSVATVGVPAEVEELIGTSAPLEVWTKLVERSESMGPVSFFSRERETWHPEDLLFVPLRNGGGDLVGVLSVGHPHSGRFPDEEQRTVLELFAVQAAAVIDEGNRRALLGDRRLLYRTLFAETPAPTLIVDEDLVVNAANDALAKLLATSSDALVGASFLDLVELIDRAPVRQMCERVLAGAVEEASIEHRVRRTDGAVTWMRTGIGQITTTLSGVRLVINLEEVTEARRRIEELQYLSDHDALTGLINREATYDLLVGALDGCGPDETIAVLACGPDDFGGLVRRSGHAVADELLVRIARRLEGALAPGDRLCRPGEDAFTIIARVDRGEPEALGDLVRRAMAAIRPRFDLRTGTHDLTLSVGSVVAEDIDDEPASLLEGAAAALRTARMRATDSWLVGTIEPEGDVR